jgi:hypothetical protein
MIASLGAAPEAAATRPAAQAPQSASPDDKQAEAIKQRFEQMLWAEMLTHAGLDKAFTQGGGEAASAFSRYVVEEIAKDLAATHPLGLAGHIDTSSPGAAAIEGKLEP